MFIKNYSDTDFKIKYKGQEKTLYAKDITYIDDKWISYPMIHTMFGGYIGLVECNTPIEEFLFDNQVLAKPNQIYQVCGKGPGKPRIFIKGGKATFYFSDNKPETIEDMFASYTLTNVSGVFVLEDFTNYVAYKADDNVKVIYNNIKFVE